MFIVTQIKPETDVI